MTRRKASETGSIGEVMEATDDRPVVRAMAPTLGELWSRRLARRDVLKGIGKAALLASASALPLAACGDAPDFAPDDIFSFEEVPHGVDETHHVAGGHSADILIRWGDPYCWAHPNSTR